MKNKKLTALFLVITVFILSFVIPTGVNAQEQIPQEVYTESDGYVIAAEKDFEYIATPKNNPKWALITKYNGTDTKIILPEKIDGYTVKTLSTYVFKECTKLTHVYLPMGVNVSGQTFAECRSLEAIEVAPDHESYVSENGVLYNYDKTTLLAYPNALEGEFTIPETVLTIGGYAFSGAYRLTKVNMYNTLSAISEGAFLECDGLEYIKLSDCLKVLGKKALAGCDSLREIHLPASLSIIGEDAVLGELSSKDEKQYYFTDGIYCVNKSYAYDYVYKLGIRAPYLIKEDRTFTDLDSGISLIDVRGILPMDKDFLIKVTPVAPDSVKALLPVRYNDILSYDVSLLLKEEASGEEETTETEYTPSASLIITFNNLPRDTIITTAKIYRTTDTKAFELLRSPHTPFVAAQTKKLGTFTIINNNDFSKKGDIDGDGLVTSYDARFALCIAAGLVTDITDAQLLTANVDGTDGVDTSDASTILRYAAGIIN
ncbi:MAG: hypothetical protein E7530_00660 [Ruminococcaceae bacterium]|nr:hypothetical protein [Oscillospiraceae bacterium]